MFWNEIYRDGRQCLEVPHKEVRSFIEEARYDAAVRSVEPHILESGVGMGRNVKFAKCMLQNIGTIVSTDICTEAIDKLQKEQIQALVRDMRDSPCSSGTVTHAISWRALHCLDGHGRDEALDEKRRVIKPYGKLLLAVRSQEDPYFGHGENTEPGTFTVVIQQHMPPGTSMDGRYDPHPWHFYSPTELYSVLERHGFSVEAMAECTELPGSFKYGALQHHYWAVKAVRERRNLLWTGFSHVTK